LGKVKQFLNEGVNQGLILHFLMLTAQFEYSLKTQFQAILTAKQEKWDECKKESSDRMRELGEYFSGEKPLTHIKKNEKLQKWFSEAIASTIDSLDWKEQTVAGRKMQQLVQALEEVEQYHQIETNLPVRQFLIDTRKYLKKMLRIVNIGDDVMATVRLTVFHFHDHSLLLTV
jgi:WASH complex subunit strumpellin